MTDIDPEKLEEAIWSWSSGKEESLLLVLEAARAHLATLPRFKEVEVELWVRFDGQRVQGFASNLAEVSENIEKFGGYAVRLTGTAKVRA